MTLGIGPLSSRYKPLKVSPVCWFFRLSRCGCGGGRGTARTISGRTTVPAIKDRKSRRSIVLDQGGCDHTRPRGSDTVELLCNRPSQNETIYNSSPTQGKDVNARSADFSCNGVDQKRLNRRSM